MARRSRSQRPKKARTSDAPAAKAPAPAGSVAPSAPPARAAAPPGPIDELAALDAGWDDLST
jgi:hypothetical protein